MEDYDQDPVAFDMGVSTLVRINYWLWKSNQASFDENPVIWFRSLKNVYAELSPFCKLEDIKLKEIESEYKKYLNYVQRHRKGEPFKPPRKIFDCLFELSIVLRKKADEKGLLMRKGEDAGSTITRM